MSEQEMDPAFEDFVQAQMEAHKVDRGDRLAEQLIRRERSVILISNLQNEELGRTIEGKSLLKEFIPVGYSLPIIGDNSKHFMFFINGDWFVTQPYDLAKKDVAEKYKSQFGPSIIPYKLDTTREPVESVVNSFRQFGRNYDLKIVEQGTADGDSSRMKFLSVVALNKAYQMREKRDDMKAMSMEGFLDQAEKIIFRRQNRRDSGPQQ